MTFPGLEEDDDFDRTVDMGRTKKDEGILGTMANIGKTLDAYKNIIALASAGT